jgi:hypothetical protein
MTGVETGALGALALLVLVLVNPSTLPIDTARPEARKGIVPR